MEQETQTQATETTETAPATETAPTETGWNYAEGVAGSGDRPEWFNTKYNTMEDQAKGYNELQSKLGGFTGNPDAYTLNDGVTANADNPLFTGLQEIGAKYGMNNDMYNEIISMHNANDPMSEVSQAQARETQIKQLGDNAESRIKNLQDWVGANVPAEFKENILNWTQTAQDVQALEAFIGMTKGQKLASEGAVNTTPAFSEDGLKELQFAENDRGQRLMSVDPTYANKVRAYTASLMELQN